MARRWRPLGSLEHGGQMLQDRQACSGVLRLRAVGPLATGSRTAGPLCEATGARSISFPLKSPEARGNWQVCGGGCRSMQQLPFSCPRPGQTQLLGS